MPLESPDNTLLQIWESLSYESRTHESYSIMRLPESQRVKFLGALIPVKIAQAFNADLKAVLPKENFVSSFSQRPERSPCVHALLRKEHTH